jgi:hypothetical protein
MSVEDAISEKLRLSDFNRIINESMDSLLNDKGLSIEKANKKDRGKAFQEFYLKEIATFLLNLDDDDIESGLRCDGSRDLNIDFVYFNGVQYYIYQSKFKGKKSHHLTRDEISGFFNIHTRILDRDFLNLNANDDVLDLLDDFSEKSEVVYTLITNAKNTIDNEAEIKLQMKKMKKHTDKASWEVKGLSELKDDYVRAQSINNVIPDEICIPITKIQSPGLDSKTWAFLDITDLICKDRKYATLICTIKGTELKNLYRQYKESLFNYNIRSFLGLNPINKKMRETIDRYPEKFYYFNNGLSAICTDYNIVCDDKNQSLNICCKNFQIINGAQTTACIGTYRDDPKLKDVQVLLRITKTEDLKKEKKGLNRLIIMYNNSQTVIKISDFRSNDDIQLFLEEKLKDYMYVGCVPYRNLVYLPKRKKFKASKDKLHIKLDTLARALYAFHYDPVMIQMTAKRLFDTESENGGKYWYIFGDNGEEVSHFPKSKIDEIASICFIWFKLEELLKRSQKELKLQGKGDTVEYQTYLTKWHFLALYGYILRTVYSKDLNTIYRNTLKGKFWKTKNFIVNWFSRIDDIICDVLDDAYHEAKEKTSLEEAAVKGFNFRNWLRSERAWNKILRKCRKVSKETFPI